MCSVRGAPHAESAFTETVLGAKPSAPFPQVVLTAAQERRVLPSFVKDSETSRGVVICPKSHSLEVAKGMQRATDIPEHQF